MPSRTLGARRIVSSLWPVEDEATAKLMSYLYVALKDGGDASEALQRAARRLRDDGWEHPYDWAAFTIAGEPYSRVPVCTRLPGVST